MTLQRFIFENTDGETVGEWTVRDIGHEMEENHSIGTIIVLSGKRFEIIGRRAPTLARDKDAWARILIVWPHTA
jgi:hypothetical protein